MPDVLHVIVVVQAIDQAVELFHGLGVVHIDPVVRGRTDCRLGEAPAGLLKRLKNIGEVFRFGIDDIGALVILEVLGPGLDGLHHQSLGINLFPVCGIIKHQSPALLKHEAHAAGGAEIAAVAVKGMADIAGGTVAIVGQRADNKGHSGGTVTLVADFLKVGRVHGAGRTLDAALDVVARHVLALGLRYNIAQGTIDVRIGPTGAHGNLNLPPELREYLGPGRIRGSLFSFDVTPLGMTGHRRAPCRQLIWLFIIIDWFSRNKPKGRFPALGLVRDLAADWQPLVIAGHSLIICPALAEQEPLSSLLPLLGELAGSGTRPERAVRLAARATAAVFAADPGGGLDRVLIDILLDTPLCSPSAGPALRRAAAHDLEILRELASLPFQAVRSRLVRMAVAGGDTRLAGWIDRLPGWEVGSSVSETGCLPCRVRMAVRLRDRCAEAGGWAALLPELIDFHRSEGPGPFNRTAALVWEGADFAPLDLSDVLPWEALLDYDGRLAQLDANIRRFCRDGTAQDMLLTGPRGTGKSTAVRALGSRHAGAGLRLVELPARRVTELSLLIRRLPPRPLATLIVIDDLVLERESAAFGALKTVLEGGLKPRPENVLLCVTSNRRHLLRESHHEGADALFAEDERDERLSLSERFGLILPFRLPTQTIYLELVRHLAAYWGVETDAALFERAIVWSQRRQSRSPRAAEQFLREERARETMKL